jgi:hypothetical protein
MEIKMFQTMKKPSADASLKTEIKDLAAADDRSPRELSEEDVLYVAGGMMMASRTTCSCGCADDCGL